MDQMAKSKGFKSGKFGGHFSGRGPKINPFFEKLLFFSPVGRGRVLLEDPGDISAVMG